METSHIQYNDENALSYTLCLAFYSARQKYKIFRELPTGKGYADLVFLPRPLHTNLPALVVELKWDKNTKAASSRVGIAAMGKHWRTMLAEFTPWASATTGRRAGMSA